MTGQIRTLYEVETFELSRPPRSRFEVVCDRLAQVETEIAHLRLRVARAERKGFECVEDLRIDLALLEQEREELLAEAHDIESGDAGAEPEGDDALDRTLVPFARAVSRDLALARANAC